VLVAELRVLLPPYNNSHRPVIDSPSTASRHDIYLKMITGIFDKNSNFTLPNFAAIITLKMSMYNSW